MNLNNIMRDECKCVCNTAAYKVAHIRKQFRQVNQITVGDKFYTLTNDDMRLS